MTQDANNRHSFILRIWREGQGQEWRGWVQHISSGESTAVQTLVDLWDFIERQKDHLVSQARPGQTQDNDGRMKSSLK